MVEDGKSRCLVFLAVEVWCCRRPSPRRHKRDRLTSDIMTNSTRKCELEVIDDDSRLALFALSRRRRRTHCLSNTTTIVMMMMRCFLLLLAASAVASQSVNKGDLRNPDSQRIRLSEPERIGEYHKRNYTWPVKEYKPETPGWRKLMDNRFAQVSEIEDRGQRYEGMIQTIHSA